MNLPDVVIERYLGGESPYEIAADYGVSRGSVRNLLIRSGIELRGRQSASDAYWERNRPKPDEPQLCECGCGEYAPIAKTHRPERGVRKGQAMRFIRGHHARVPEIKGRIFTKERNEKIGQAHRDGRIPNPKPKSGELNPMWRGDEVGYSGAHQRLRIEKGSPVDHSCFACGKPAQEWAVNQSHPSIIMGKHGGWTKPYSPHPEAYYPLCRSCHRTADRNGGFRL